MAYDPDDQDDNTDDSSSNDLDNWDSEPGADQENLPDGDGYGR